MKTLYEAQATAVGGRSGVAATADGRVSVTLSLPQELGGEGGEGTNPEQLFALAYASCFLTSIKSVAGERKIELAADSNVTATIGVGPRDDGKGLSLDIALLVDLPGLDAATAQDIVDRAHVACPYSDATRKLDVRIRMA
jgi:osmotically inducible protein OsmC